MNHYITGLYVLTLFHCIFAYDNDDTNHDSCYNEIDCQVFPYIEPFPLCQGEECRCSNGSCIHYTVGKNGKANYFCGDCGAVGSKCSSHSCEFPGDCFRDNFCHCSSGYLVKDICVFYNPVTATKTNACLIFVLLLIIIVNRIIVSWKSICHFLRNLILCGCCRRDSGNRQRNRNVQQGTNPISGTKSAAFTISTSEFMTTSEDNDLQWALELSRQAISQNAASFSDETDLMKENSFEFHIESSSVEFTPSSFSEEQTEITPSASHSLNSLHSLPNHVSDIESVSIAYIELSAVSTKNSKYHSSSSSMDDNFAVFESNNFSTSSKSPIKYLTASNSQITTTEKLATAEVDEKENYQSAKYVNTEDNQKISFHRDPFREFSNTVDEISSETGAIKKYRSLPRGFKSNRTT